MREVEAWITRAGRELGVPIERVAAPQADRIVRDARERFVAGDPRAWWLSLALPAKQFPSDGAARLGDLLPRTSDRCWLIPETDGDRLPVFGVATNEVERVVAQCPFFEYYVLGLDLSWLVIESDHNVLFVCEVDSSV